MSTTYHPGDAPVNLAEAVLRWAVNILHSRGYSTVGLACSALQADASTRKFLRLTNLHRESWIAMLLSDRETDYLATEVSTSELPFVTFGEFLLQRNWPVPRVIFHDANLDWLLIEDFGDVRLQEALIGVTVERKRKLYGQAMKLLVKLQLMTYDARESNSIAARRVLDEATLRWEFFHYVEWGIEALHSTSITETERATLDSEFGRLSQEIVSAGYVLVHRDYHSRNLMVLPDGELGVLDFQDAVLGSPTYDVTSLLLDSYVSLGWEFVNDCVEDFHWQLVGAGVVVGDIESFRRLFHIQGIQRCLKAAGRFVYLARVCQNPGLLPVIPPTLEFVRRMLDIYDDLATVRECLVRYEQRLAR